MVKKLSYASKIFKMFIFFSFVFNVLVSNGYSYVLFTQVANQLSSTKTIFKMENNHIVLAQTVNKDVQNMFGVTKNMLNLAGFVDGLFNTADENIAGNENQSELKVDASNNLVFDMFNCLYIFSLSDLLVNLQIGNTIKFESEITPNYNSFEIKRKVDSSNIIYDVIKDFFIIQNVENHAKVFLNIVNTL